MNPSTFDLLCEASQLSFPDAEKESFMRGLESMILFAGAVRGYDCVYDDKKDAEPVSIKDLREDKSAPSYLPGKLLENTDSLFDCCVIPKLMD
jgi:Asp-tRNA(Asn)/Glu-tRNA(Gln) amidotransferase C subunit